MSIVDDILEHHGIKGMKWGIRRDWMATNNPDVARSAAANERVANATTVSGFNRALANQAKVQREIKLAKKSQSRGARKLDNKIQAHEKIIKSAQTRLKLHEDEVADLQQNGIHAAVMQKRFGRILDSSDFSFASVHGMSKETAVKEMLTEASNKAKTEQAVINRTNKRLAKLQAKKTSMMHSDVTDEQVDAFLEAFDREDIIEHFGVKGMRWGVRRSQAQLDAASTDHSNATAAKVKARKHGTKALSNKELQDLINRMNLEQQYSRVVTAPVKKRIISGGLKFAVGILAQVGKQQATSFANDQATKLLAAALKR